jgi:hypothetical protein
MEAETHAATEPLAVTSEVQAAPYHDHDAAPAPADELKDAKAS